MRTCAREFRRGRPSAHYKAARNGPAPEKERHFGAFSLPRFRPFPSPVLRSVRPRSGRCLDRASDSCPLLACLRPDPCSVRPAIDPASRRSDFRGADSGMPDPRLSDRASAASILGCPIRCRSTASPTPTSAPIESLARPTRFDPILPIRPSDAVGEYLYEVLKLPVVAVVPHPERDPLLDPVVSCDLFSRFERFFLFLRLRAESAPA